MKTSPGFVDSVWELLGPLLAGTPSLVVPDPVVREPRLLLEWLARHQVTHLVVVPSLLRALLDRIELSAPAPPALRLWSCSGEPLPTDLAARFRQAVPGARLLNLYGSSEVAADATVHEATTSAWAGATVPLGLPIDNVTVHVLDDAMTPTPVDVVGEVWIGGLAVASGYLDRPADTAERFVPDPFRGAGERLYRTGDLARRGEDGTIVFVGRTDHQVKVRGARVELAEVEAALERQPAVEHAVASVTFGDEPDLVAHVTGGPDLDAPALRRALAAELPSFLVPTTIVTLATLPLLPNGKVDRRRLPAGQVPTHKGEATSPPRTSVQRSVAAIWGVVLHVEQPDLADDFFAMGGHSLLAMRLVARISKTLGVEVPLRVVFDTPTLGALAAHVEASLKEGDGAVAAPIRRVDRSERAVGVPPTGTGRIDVDPRNGDVPPTTPYSPETTTPGGDQR